MVVVSSPTYWSVQQPNGQEVSLQNFCQNITTLGGDRLAPAPLRGANLVVPGVVGQTWMPKIVDSRTITLGMWVNGANPDGTIPRSQDAQQAFYSNFTALRNLLWSPYSQFLLYKRFYVNGVLTTAYAKAQYASGLDPTMNGPSSAAFTVDLLLAEPYFYTAPSTINLTTGVGSSDTSTVVIGGDAETSKIAFTVNGARAHPKVHSNTLDVQWEYTPALNAGDVLSVDVPSFTATTTPSGASTYTSSGSVLHTGDTNWFVMQPGSNTIVASSDSGTGLMTMTYREAYL